MRGPRGGAFSRPFHFVVRQGEGIEMSELSSGTKGVMAELRVSIHLMGLGYSPTDLYAAKGRRILRVQALVPGSILARRPKRPPKRHKKGQGKAIAVAKNKAVVK